MVDPAKIRAALVDAIKLTLKQVDGASRLNAHNIFNEVKCKLQAEGSSQEERETQHVLLVAVNDLFRNGVLMWGRPEQFDTAYCTLTAHGKETFKHWDRDPANRDAYVQQIGDRLKNAVALSYVTEAVDAYNAGLVKAAAVMLGAASEAIVLQIRDVLREQLTNASRTVPNKLASDKAKPIIEGIYEELSKHKAKIPKVDETMQAYWVALTNLIRMARNDAGHPATIEPVTRQAVHAALLLFPQLVQLANDIQREAPKLYS